MSQILFSQISQPRQVLIRLCQSINHGSIENLQVENSEPVFDPSPVMLKDVKLDSDEGPRPELGLADFLIGDEAHRLTRLFDNMKCGSVRRLEIRAGIPRRIVVESVPPGPA
jgi:hypothetical protein